MSAITSRKRLQFARMLLSCNMPSACSQGKSQCRGELTLRPAGLWQDPAAADRLTKIQRDLDDTKVVLHQTIESMLERGEKLENLVDKSTDLSMASQMFYKQAKKTNSCCRMM